MTSTALQRTLKTRSWAGCRPLAPIWSVRSLPQLPQLFKAHRDGMNDVFWDFLWKEIIGLIVLCGTSVIWALLAAGVFGTAA